MLKKLWQWLNNNDGLVLILLLVFILRIPSLHEPYWYGDEGIYLTLGQALRKGLVWYRDIHDNKPPLLYLLASLAHSLLYFRLILAVWFAAAVAVFYRLMQLMFPKNKPAWYLSTLIMVGLTTVLEGNIANAEIFMILPTLLGVLLVLQRSSAWLSGLCFSLAFLFKVPAGFEFGAVVLWLILFQKVRLKQLVRLVLGFSLPIIGSIAYYAIAGGLEPYVRSALLQNIGYLTSWKAGEHSASGLITQLGLIKRTALITVALAWLYWLAKKFKLSRLASLAIIWFLLALFGALLSERPYPHYLIQPAVPGAILVSFFVFGKRKILKLIILTAGLMAGLWYYQIKFWSYPIIPYYQNFLKFAAQQKSLEDYRSFFDSRVNQTYQLVDYLKEKTLANDRIFIWGNEPYIYALSERLPLGRYTVAYHVIDFNGYQETLTAWQKNPPKVVIVMEYEKNEFPEMQARLATNYLLTDKIQQALIYRRLESK